MGQQDLLWANEHMAPLHHHVGRKDWAVKHIILLVTVDLRQSQKPKSQTRTCEAAQGNLCPFK